MFDIVEFVRPETTVAYYGVFEEEISLSGNRSLPRVSSRCSIEPHDGRPHMNISRRLKSLKPVPAAVLPEFMVP